METDQDYLRTETAIDSRASHEHYLRFLVYSSGKLQLFDRQLPIFDSHVYSKFYVYT